MDKHANASCADHKDQGKTPDPGCCEGDSCGCDDTCIDELARVICADDDTHLHTRAEAGSRLSGDASIGSDCTCCDEDKEIEAEDKADGEATTQSTPPKPVQHCAHSGLRKRTTAQRPSSSSSVPKQACGEHRNMARNRYNDTLAAFGCVCKALLARGLKSCCTPPSLAGKAIAWPPSSKHGAKLTNRRTSAESSRAPSVSSCCGKSDCGGGQALSIRSLPYSGHVGSRSVRSRSCASVDSCCRDSCCGDGSDEKSEHVAIDMAEKGAGAYNEHVVLAIKGMTCTGCENKLIRTLKGIPAIHNAKTSLVLCRAEFDFDNDATDITSLAQLIEKRSGFSAEVIKAGFTRDLLINVPRSLQEQFMAAARPNGVQVAVRSGKDTLIVKYDPNLIGARDVIEAYCAFTPVLAPEPLDPSIAAGAKHVRLLSARAVLSALLTIPVLVMTWAPLPPHPHAYAIASLVLASIVQVAITGPFYISSFKSLVFSRLVETELLIVLSTTAAYVYSVVAFAFEMVGRPLATGQFFETSTLLVTLIMVGQVISAIARQRAIEAISIRSLQEKTACIVFPDKTERVLDVRLLHSGDKFKVLPDSAIITDGEVISGTSTVDESMMTGESRPVEKGPGDAVIAGTLNGPSTLVVKVTRLPGENTISEIAGMVDDARFSRARVQETVDWVCGWFVPVVLALAIVTFAVWMGVGVSVRHQSSGHAAVVALTYAISVLAISCPCAVGLAVPMVILIAGGVGAKLGLVFKSATTIEQARKVTHVVLDKTGTVTQGKLSVTSRFIDEDPGFDVLSVVAELVASSRHPVARAVAADLKLAPPAKPSVDDIEMVTGRGVQGDYRGKLLRGGSAQWVGMQSHPAVQPLLAQGLTTFCVIHGMRLVAAFGLSDALRPETQSVIKSLTARNIRVSILSGDHPAAVSSTAAMLGIPPERVRASCLPADKQVYIKDLAAQGEIVLFCGDGTNDAVALAQAAVGVHLHTGEGAGVAASTAADVVLTHPSLVGIVTLLELSDAVARRITANFAWSAIYNLVAILLAAGAFVHARIPPAYAGLGEVVSVVPVVLVAMQLKWFKAVGTMEKYD
ncbi:heavy metal translocatin [Dichomitus squalens LYAD-421 SS1]|uniref:heavy metal translocatin n=1 Tax=Dichomitus squalens (strain LYAD-421) TaxID=732165 RepID=UPI0004412A5D|nr:heavy metal translocatin [Dichomitus squalens LYAD-421 SS1]EJF64323.1 heavy metal translocatin [Dichomitus squalens LYAD-421 SS1]